MLQLTPSRKFRNFQTLLGIYLVIHFLRNLPVSSDLFSLSGMKVLGGELYLKSALRWLREPLGIYGLHILGILASLALGFQVKSRWASAILFLIWVFLFHQNILIYTPAHPYVGWMLLAFLFVPKGKEERLPGILFSGLWIIYGLTYSSSGFHKLIDSQLWQEGRALDYILTGPSVRFAGLGDFYTSLPLLIRKLSTWSALVVECLFFPCIFFSLTRKSIWCFILLMHLMILVTLDFTELSICMIILQLFLIEEEWFGRKAPEQSSGA